MEHWTLSRSLNVFKLTSSLLQLLLFYVAWLEGKSVHNYSLSPYPKVIVWDEPAHSRFRFISSTPLSDLRPLLAMRLL